MSLHQIFFILITLITFYWGAQLFLRIRRNILLGRPKVIEGPENERWKNMILVAFGQKKMFKRIMPAVLHLFIYVAFVITQIELLEIIIDGFTDQHRIFAPYLGVLYTFIISFIEILSVLALVATLVFIARRLTKKVDRLSKAEMEGWPWLDGLLILFGELALIAGIFMMNGADTVLQDVDPQHYHDTGFFAISGWLGPMLFGDLGRTLLVFIERSGWWLHLLTIYAFIIYLPKSKHLHIFFAFPNVFFAKLNPRGEMENMPAIMNEVKSMMGLTEEEPDMSAELPEFGAKDIQDLNWLNILNAYACTECGRCTDVCPANQTGKKLSPRKIMMDIRDRTEEVATKIDSGAIQYLSDQDRKSGKALTAATFDDGKSLFDYISREEIHACTACNACVEACPIMIDPLEPILQLRRYEILTESAGPSDWVPMFTSIENSGSVWQVPDARDKWTKSL